MLWVKSLPNFTIHLATARLVDQNRGPLFFVGALAPDAMDYPAKEHGHMRYAPDRAAAMAELARATDPADDFAEGVLVHYYTDWLWDTTHLLRYKNQANTNTAAWVKPYHHETKLASSWIYWNEPWAPPLWESMLALPPESYGKLPGIAPQDIHALMTRGHRWILKHRGPPSTFYPPEVVEEFAQTTAQNYITWRSNLC